jgi:hypothetical protein
VKIVRLLAVVAVLLALAWAVKSVSQSSSVAPAATPCTPSALSQGVNGAFHVMSVDNFGCAGKFAFLWATVGTTEVNAIGVTEVLQFKSGDQRWALVSRLKYCHPTTLPTLVYRQGCFSN